jgi:hypothetical protein
MAQRKLATHEKAVLIQVLRTFPDERVGICYSPSATDGRTYAEDFLSVFRAIGWHVDGPKMADEPMDAPSGLALVVPKPGLPASAEALRDALGIYGIEVQAECSGSAAIAAGSFLLRVGRPLST